jgi:hypothetical protein
MKSPAIDHDTLRDMLRTATPDRVLRFIGQRHPADIAPFSRSFRHPRFVSSSTF